VATDDIAQVHLRDNPTSGTCAAPAPSPVGGSMPSPYCQVIDALNDIGGRHFVKVAPSSETGHPLYGAIDLNSGVTAYLVGPGPSASPVFGLDGGNHSINIAANSGQIIDLTFDGFHFNSTDTGSSNLVCDSNGGPTTLTVRNSLVVGGHNCIHASACTLNVSETNLQGALGGDGLFLDSGSSYDAHNVMISGCGFLGAHITSASKGGNFSFNTLAFNGTGGGVGGVTCDSAFTLYDSIIAGNVQVTGTQFGGSCVLNNVVTGTDTLTTGAIASPPAFVSGTAPYDLHLDVSDAPSGGANTMANRACCIDKVPAATPAPSPLPSIDIDRDKRPIGAAWDIGADEAL
jgi:hypothetical protein